MKNTLVLLALLITATVNGQSLKDLLFSGKMKSDSNSVIRKGDDLKDKIDTGTRKPVPKPDSIAGLVKKDSSAAPATVKQVAPAAMPDSAAMVNGTVPGAQTLPAPAAPVNPNVENNRRWKQFVDTVTGSIKAEVLPNKKIKKGDYSVIVDYSINTDGTVTIGNIYISPESDMLLQQLKERLGIDTPALIPATGSNGAARKTNKRYNFIISKN